MNTVNIIGRLTADPELIQVGDTQKVSFSVAVDRAGGKKGDSYESGFFRVEAWGNRAETVSKYFSKGSKIGLTGELRHDRWEKDGEKRESVKISMSDFTFVDSKSDGSNPSNKSTQGSSGQESSSSDDDYDPFQD